MIEKEYLIALCSFVPFGPTRVELLIKYFGSARTVWESSESALKSTGLQSTLVENFIEFRNEFSFDAYFDKLKNENIRVITKFEKEYPTNLIGVKNCPVVLYIRGRFKKCDTDSVAIVGTRKMTAYGREVAEQFSSRLASVGVTVISGLALGIDSTAHISALENGGRTIAVIGCGLDSIYPVSNIGLAKRIINEDKGAIISEYPLSYPAFRQNFISRNRIISGLAKAVVVVEGAIKSGTILTANHAAEQGKTVFAIPGQINSPMSEAPFYLLKNGASMAVRPEDVLEELDFQFKVDSEEVEKLLPSDDDEKKIIEILANEKIHIDEIVRLSNLDANRVTAKLMMMELKGMIKSDGEGNFKAS